MNKQSYILSTIIALAAALLIAGCSAPSINTATNLTNKTNSNYPATNTNLSLNANRSANTAVPTPTTK